MNGMSPSEMTELRALQAMAKAATCKADLMVLKERGAEWVKRTPSRRVRRMGALRAVKGMYAQF